MTSANTILEPDTIISGEQLYNEAVGLILKSAQRELLIFDQDLSRGSFSSLESFNYLQNFLSANIASELTIILQDAGYFQQKCPRLAGLLQIYGHKMHVHVTNSSARHAKDCFILADGEHYIKRIHIDQARFKYAFNDRKNVETLNNRFMELTDAIGDAVTLRPLGL
ncbi:DUF7931 domain-containing protein [Methylotenera sp. G11]|uniref:DUF7931 domain-containing protein n=1 Tax=Methylotenera sp. G11 TaxID=1506585 RepID=UPI0006488151|nr:hypothetical protein [Methylotenera sp. G11]